MSKGEANDFTIFLGGPLGAAQSSAAMNRASYYAKRRLAAGFSFQILAGEHTHYPQFHCELSFLRRLRVFHFNPYRMSTT
jgi:hypothetical protein